MKCPEPGIYYDVPFADYLAWDAISKSELWAGRKSAAHLREAISHPKAPTEAMRRGSFIHSYCLEPQILMSRYSVAPDGDKRTKAVKEAWAAFEATLEGREPVSAEDVAIAKRMHEALRNHPTAAALLFGPGRSEVSFIWVDPHSGVTCKGRADRMLEDSLQVPDLKTTIDASPDGFRYQIAKYGYERQAAFWCDGLQVLTGRAWTMPFVAIEVPTLEDLADPDFVVKISVQVLDAESVGSGQLAYMRQLQEYRDAKRLNIWPGYPTDILTTRLPKWAFGYDVESVNDF